MVQRGGAWAGCGPAQSPPRCTKCNSPPINCHDIVYQLHIIRCGTLHSIWLTAKMYRIPPSGPSWGSSRKSIAGFEKGKGKTKRVRWEGTHFLAEVAPMGAAWCLEVASRIGSSLDAKIETAEEHGAFDLYERSSEMLACSRSVSNETNNCMCS